MEQKKRIWVHPQFADKLKHEALDKKKSVLELSKELCTDEEIMRPLKWKRIKF